MSNIIECENLIKIYKTADLEVVALQGLDLTIEQGELTAIIGNSGSGKSTLLNMIGCLDTPSAGKLFVDGKDLFKLSKKEVEVYKRETVGFVWQNNARNLIPYLTARENVELALSIGGKTKNMKEEAIRYLSLTHIDHRQNNKLSELSGGEQQRVAIAIALSNNPKILLADEPTGAVDSKTASMILDLFRELNSTIGITIVIVTHDRQLSSKVQRVVAIRDGKTSSEFIRKTSYAEDLKTLGQGLTLDGNEDTHEELAILDKAGRVQIPKDYLTSLGVDGNKIKVELDDGKIVITNPK